MDNVMSLKWKRKLVWSLSFVHSFKALCSSLPKRRVASRHSEKDLSFFTKYRGEREREGFWLPTKGTFTSSFLQNKQVGETLSKIHGESVQLHVPWQDPSSMVERVHLCHLSRSDVPSTHCLKYRGEKDAMEHKWHSYGIWCVTPTGLQSDRSCWSSAVGFEEKKCTSGSSHLCLKGNNHRTNMIQLETTCVNSLPRQQKDWALHICIFVHKEEDWFAEALAHTCTRTHSVSQTLSWCGFKNLSFKYSRCFKWLGAIQCFKMAL